MLNFSLLFFVEIIWNNCFGFPVLGRLLLLAKTQVYCRKNLVNFSSNKSNEFLFQNPFISFALFHFQSGVVVFNQIFGPWKWVHLRQICLGKKWIQMNEYLCKFFGGKMRLTQRAINAYWSLNFKIFNCDTLQILSWNKPSKMKSFVL